MRFHHVINSDKVFGTHNYRGIATRYEKTARNFLAGLHLARSAQMTTGPNVMV
jgi:hypothetical protein